MRVVLKLMILGAIPGATPDKWAARWRQRFPQLPLEVHYYDDALAGVAAQLERLREGTVDIGYIRAAEDAVEIDQDLYHRVVLYREDPVVCAAAQHWIAAAEESVTADDIAAETRFEPAEMLPEGHQEDKHTPRAGLELARGERLALETAATGAGVVVLPGSVARMLSRKDVVIRTLEGAPGYSTGLAWLRERDSDQIQEFIGVARGRRPGSGRSLVGSGAATEGRKATRSTRSGATGAGGSARRKASSKRRSVARRGRRR